MEKIPTDIIFSLDKYSLRMLNPEIIKKAFHTKTPEELKLYFGYSTLEQVEKERKEVAKTISTYKQSLRYFQIVDKDLVIGWCGFHLWYTQHERAELGYVLTSEKHRQQGIMSLVLPWVIKYGFTEMKLHRIEAYVADYNIPSVKLLENNNFKKEGLLREHYFTNNRYEDSVVYSLLKGEFKTY